MGTWNAPSGHAREWRRKRHRHRSPSASPLLRYAVIGLAAILVITLGWHGIRWTAHPVRSPAYPTVYTPPVASDAAGAAWQREYNESLHIASDELAAGNISEAEVAVDRAETIITAQRLESGAVRPDFFAPALATLDGVLAKQRPPDARLTEHITLARISLAEFRSSLEPEPPQSSDTKRVSIGVPRELAADSTLDPAKLGARVLDATIMPGTAEVLLPPSSRAFADNVRVENLIIQGAAQTLDGVRWNNVTFVDTRLRYEGGELDLENVHFVRCRFGFLTDTGEEAAGRSARLANAIAQGQSSIKVP